jgi:hypothetical protein
MNGDATDRSREIVANQQDKSHSLACLLSLLSQVIIFKIMNFKFSLLKKEEKIIVGGFKFFQ